MDQGCRTKGAVAQMDLMWHLCCSEPFQRPEEIYPGEQKEPMTTHSLYQHSRKAAWVSNKVLGKGSIPPLKHSYLLRFRLAIYKRNPTPKFPFANAQKNFKQLDLIFLKVPEM